jgi:hypothetical protein
MDMELLLIPVRALQAFSAKSSAVNPLTVSDELPEVEEYL